MLHALVLCAQVVATPYQGPTAARPIRLWLGPSPVVTGDAVPVYVAAANDGYLLVLRVGPDGQVDVVFPADPQADGHVARGTYELRAPGNRPALVATGGSGTGLVLAALSETPFRFQEFARAGRWDRGQLVASYAGADGPGTLTDIAQRMLGDGWFNSDFALFTVRTPAAQRAALREPASPGREPEVPTIGVCNGCTIVYQTVSPEPLLEQTVTERAVVERVVIVTSLCEPFLGGCHANGIRGRHRSDAPKVKTAGICQVGIDCPPGVGGPATALTMRVGRSAVPSPRPPAPVPPAEIPVAAAATAPAATQRTVYVSAAPVVRGGSVVRRVEPAAAAPAAAAPTRTPDAARAGGAMAAGRAGTSLRAARLLPPRR